MSILRSQVAPESRVYEAILEMEQFRLALERVNDQVGIDIDALNNESEQGESVFTDLTEHEWYMRKPTPESPLVLPSWNPTRGSYYQMKHGQPLLREMPETWPEENERDRKLEILFSHGDFMNANQEFADVGRIRKMSARAAKTAELEYWSALERQNYILPEGQSWETRLPATNGYGAGQFYKLNEPEGALDVDCWVQSHQFKINIFLQDPTQSFVAIGNVELEGTYWDATQTDLKSMPRGTDQISRPVSGGGNDQLDGRCSSMQGGWAIRYHWNERVGRGYFGFDTIEHRYNWADTTCDWLYQEGGVGNFVNPETGEVVETYMCDDRTGGKLPGNASQWGFGGAALIGSSEITEPGWYELILTYKIGTEAAFDWSAGTTGPDVGFNLNRYAVTMYYEEDGVTPKLFPFRKVLMRVNNVNQQFSRYGPATTTSPWSSYGPSFVEQANYRMTHDPDEARSIYQMDDIGQSFVTSDYRNCRPRVVINTRVRKSTSSFAPGYSYKYEWERQDQKGGQEYSEATINSWGLGKIYHIVNPSSILTVSTLRSWNPETEKWENTENKVVSVYETDAAAWMSTPYYIGYTYESPRFKDFVGKIVEPGRQAFEWLKVTIGALVALVAVQLFYKGK